MMILRELVLIFMFEKFLEFFYRKMVNRCL